MVKKIKMTHCMLTVADTSTSTVYKISWNTPGHLDKKGLLIEARRRMEGTDLHPIDASGLQHSTDRYSMTLEEFAEHATLLTREFDEEIENEKRTRNKEERKCSR